MREDWIAGWEEFVSIAPSPTLFRKWTGIALLAGAMERKCWVRTLGRPLFPNMYTLLVAPPGVGKSFLTSMVWEFWSKLGTHKLASSSLTKAALIDDLKDAERHVIRQGEPTISFNSLLVVSNELGVLLPTYDSDFMSALTDIYDGYPYSERRRSKDIQFLLKAPQLNLLAATTPGYLRSVLPEGAWDQGFLSRCMLIYSGESLIGDLFNSYHADNKVQERLVKELKQVGSLYGEFSWDEDAMQFVQQWHEDKGPPIPDHPKLANYLIRRTAHLLKLCQVASVSESDKLHITLDHVQRALDWLIEAELYMPDIFKALAQGGDTQVIKECYHFAYHIYVKDKKPIPEYRLIRFLQERTPSHNVERILEVMIRGALLKRKDVHKVGPAYVPGTPDRH